jgi:hypothetical protein
MVMIATAFISRAKIGVSIAAGRYLTQRIGVVGMINVAKNMQGAETVREALAHKYPNYTVTVTANSLKSIH